MRGARFRGRHDSREPAVRDEWQRASPGAPMCARSIEALNDSMTSTDEYLTLDEVADHPSARTSCRRRPELADMAADCLGRSPYRAHARSRTPNSCRGGPQSRPSCRSSRSTCLERALRLRTGLVLPCAPRCAPPRPRALDASGTGRRDGRIGTRTCRTCSGTWFHPSSHHRARKAS